MSGAVWFWVSLGGVLIGAVLSAVQLALRSVTRTGVEALAVPPGARDEGLPETLEKILDDISGHAASVAVPRVLANLVTGVAIVLWIGGVPLSGAEGELASAADGITAVEALVGVAVAAVAIWAFSVALPLAIAEHAAERVVIAFAYPVHGLAVVLSPLRGVLAFTTEVVRRLAGETARTTAEAREAELLSLVEESEREGDLDESAREMIEAVVEFRSTTVEQIMTPRTDIQGLEYTDDLATVKKAAAAATHSRIPVYDDTIDSIRGVLYLKDLLHWLVRDKGTGAGFSLGAVTREATFVPETKTVRELLSELLEKKVHIAFATDEYGGISGLVTIEDIIEEVFGEIRDEYEPEDKPDPQVVVDRDARSAEIDGRVEVDDANDELETIGLELPEHDDWDTVGGFVVTTMGKIPDAGETLVHEGVAITILEAEPTRVVRVRVTSAEATAVA